MKKQAGFTLVEIAIVLVIIGLLLGGVLKGQELINSAKVKNFASDFRTIPTFVYAYQDRFRALPGDDPRAGAPFATPNLPAPAVVATTAPGGAVGDARINGPWNSIVATDESVLFWQHVRLAGLATGTPIVGANAADPYFPRNADGGRLGITGNPVGPGWTANFFVCSSGIQGRFARQLDVTIDDGNTSTGTIRVLDALAAPGGAGGELATGLSFYTVTANDDATLYTVCAAS